MRPDRFLAAGCAAAALALCAGAAGPAGATSTPSAPVIHERFTLLPCTGKPARRTTLQLEGCAEHRVVSRDQAIDRLNASVFSKLFTVRGKRSFIVANGDWLRFRDHACTSASDNHGGGSVAPVAYADCLATLDSAHMPELRALLKALRERG